MSYSRLWGGGSWYIYQDVGGYLQVYFDNTSSKKHYSDGTFLRITENQHITPLLAGLADLLKQNVEGWPEERHREGRKPELPSPEQWYQILDAWEVLGNLLKDFDKIGCSENVEKYPDMKRYNEFLKEHGVKAADVRQLLEERLCRREESDGKG